MSREQWGHGYWQGVRDVTNGKVRSTVKEWAYFCCLQMRISNSHKAIDRTLFPVRELFIMLEFAEVDAKKITKDVYEYVLNHGEGFGGWYVNFGNKKNPNYQMIYISGEAKSDMYDDYFVILPADNNEEIEELRAMRDAVIEKMKEKGNM